MRTVLNILLVQLFQFSQTYFLRNKSTEISFWCWFPGIHSRKLSKHWLLYISDYFAGVGVTLGKLLAWLRRSEFDWHPQLFQFLHQTVASGSSVFPWCCHLLRVIERDRVYFLLKNLIAVPSQLHLVHCNQTNHGGWWSMIAFRLACLHIVLSLSFFFFFSFYGHLLQVQDCEAVEMEERQRAWEASVITVKSWLHSLWLFLVVGL